MARRAAALVALTFVLAAAAQPNLAPRVAALEAAVVQLQARVTALEAGPSPSPTTTVAPTSAPTASPTVGPTSTPTVTLIPPFVEVNVRAHGATGNGTTNDTAAFVAAQNAALAGSKVVYVPAGTYAITSLVLRAGVTIRGDGTAVIKRFGLGPHGVDVGLLDVRSDDVTISDLTIRGTGKRLTDTGQTGRGDDILINGNGADRLKVLRVALVDAQGIGSQLQNLSGALFEDVSITSTFVRDNGFHGVALWPYHGTNASTFRRITIDGADYAGIMLDAGTNTGTAQSVDDNVFEDVVIRNAARYHIGGGGVGGGWLFTGAKRNTVTRYEITDIPGGSALAFGIDQSGLGSSGNVLRTGAVARVSSGIVAAFAPTADGNTLDGGTGAGRVTGSAGNTFLNWPGLVLQ